MSVKKLFTHAVIIGLLNLFIIGCSDEGPAEKAGKKIDDAIKSLKEKIKD